ncbi:hypothetical protein MNBD_GAMMA19-1687 [hydrothermal vent metagenome]|uniref:Lipoprotein n=1 Tax=hydrothermal vent metagenome TaxID=652676 RepID=A0A3B1BEN6_9ZZZZ
MKMLKYCSSALVIIVLLQGCSTGYFGHTKTEWDKLTDVEKATVKEEYQTAINAKNGQAHADKIKARTQSVIDCGVQGGKFCSRISR